MNYSIVRGPGEAEVLLLKSEEGWSLPGHSGDEAAGIGGEITRQVGLDVVCTGCVRDVREADGTTSSVYAHELRDRGTEAEPAGGARWFGRGELSRLELPQRQREVLEDWFTGLRDGADHLPKVSWARPGWFADASAWMCEQAEREGARVTGPVEQFLVSPWSCHLRVPTTKGHRFLKAAPDVFGHEGELTRLLGEWFPDNLPEVVAVDAGRHWMLTRDVSPFTEITPVPESRDAYERALRRYGQIQQRAVGETDRLRAVGCPDWSLEKLPSLYEQLLAEKENLLLGAEDGLSGEEYETLAGFVPRFREMCAELAAYGLPETLVNMDFWRGNIAYTTDGFRFFDWGETGLAHPMFSLVAVLRDFELNDFPGGEETRQRLIDTHLSAWSGHLDEDRLAEAFELAQAGAIVCRTLCWRNCLAQLADSDRYLRYRPAVVVNLRRLLTHTSPDAARS